LIGEKATIVHHTFHFHFFSPPTAFLIFVQLINKEPESDAFNHLMDTLWQYSMFWVLKIEKEACFRLDRLMTIPSLASWPYCGTVVALLGISVFVDRKSFSSALPEPLCLPPCCRMTTEEKQAGSH
jgi:hypothetical protein